MTDNQNPKKQTNNKWLALINIPIQMGAIIFLFSYLGNWLDEKYPNSHNRFLQHQQTIERHQQIFIKQQ